MNIQDLPIEAVSEDKKIAISEIKKGDAVLVYNDQNKKPHIFCSDGRVAQSDIIIDRNWIRYLQGSPEELFPYGPRKIVDEAIRRGYLKEVIGLFGREAEIYDHPASAHEHEIVTNGPIIMFGYLHSQYFDITVSAGNFHADIDLFCQHNPYTEGNKGNSFMYPCGEVKRIVIGRNAILSELKQSPLEIALRQCEVNKDGGDSVHS